MPEVNFAFWAFCEIRRRFMVLWHTLYYGAHTFFSHKSMLPSLRNRAVV